MYQQREVQVQRFDAKDYLAKVAPTDAEIEAYYKDPANAAQFRAPEQATIEYVVLDLEAVKKGIAVSEDDLRKYYAENEKRYTAPEERRASHILVKADKDAPKAEREQGQGQGRGAARRGAQEPAEFAEIAKKNSDDEGSAAKGGDLDFFGRGAMVKPFEDAAFAPEAGRDRAASSRATSATTSSSSTGVRGGEKKSFESVRAEIEAEVKQPARAEAVRRGRGRVRRHGLRAVREPQARRRQAGSSRSHGAARDRARRRRARPAPLANAKFLEALFCSDATPNKRNTKAIDVGAEPARCRPRRPVHAGAPAAAGRGEGPGAPAARRAAGGGAGRKKLGAERLAAARAAPQTRARRQRR